MTMRKLKIFLKKHFLSLLKNRHTVQIISKVVVTYSPTPMPPIMAIKHLTQSIYNTYLILNNVIPGEP